MGAGAEVDASQGGDKEETFIGVKDFEMESDESHADSKMCRTVTRKRMDGQR